MCEDQTLSHLCDEKKKLRQPEADSAMYSLVERKEKLVSQVQAVQNIMETEGNEKDSAGLSAAIQRLRLRQIGCRAAN